MDACEGICIKIDLYSLHLYSLQFRESPKEPSLLPLKIIMNNLGHTFTHKS
jgi:hypothetical protein